MATNNADFKVKKGLTVTDDINVSGDINVSSLYGRLNFKKNAAGNVNNDAIYFINSSDQYAGAVKYFHSGNTLRLQANQDDQLHISDGAIYPPVDSDVDLGTTSLRFKDTFVDSITVTGAVTPASITLGGHAFNDIDIGSEHVDTDDHIMSSGAIKEYVDANAGDVSVGTHAGNNNLAFFSSAGVISNSNNASFTSATGAVDFFGSVEAGNVKIGTNTNKNTVETSSAQDLILRTNGGTNSGTVTLTDGANGDISITPHGTGQVTISAQMTSRANVVAVTSGTQLTAAQSGSYVYVTGVGAVELPDNATVGLQYTIFNNKGSSLTVTLGTNNSIVSNWATNAEVADNEATSYVCVSAGNWVQIG